MRGLCHVFSWLTQCNQAFPLAECSEENPVPYRAGNRDHGVTDGTQNRALLQIVGGDKLIIPFC